MQECYVSLLQNTYIFCYLPQVNTWAIVLPMWQIYQAVSIHVIRTSFEDFITF